MKHKRHASIMVFALVASFAGAAAALTGVDTAQMDRMVAYVNRLKANLGPNIKHLSGPAQIVIELGRQLEQLRADAIALSAVRGGGATESPYPRFPTSEMGMFTPTGAKAGRAKSASAPNLIYTRFSGAVQSGSSIAWCGNAAVVGFNDSDSFWETGGLAAFLSLSRGQSLDGYAVSANAGRSFTDKGFPPVGPAGTLMEGDPVVACGDPNTFFYAGLYEDLKVGNSAISFSRSSDGGNTFGPPIAAVTKSVSSGHLLDKPWMIVNPAAPAQIFITYTDIDTSGTGDCGVNSRTAIELVKSTDGGKTWGSPIVVVEVCGAPFVQGSQVVVNPSTGNVFVAWESFATDFYTREIDVASSTDGGETFSSPVTVGKADAVGDGAFSYGIQGFIRDFEYPTLAVGKGKNAGTLYVTWNDGDHRVKDDWVGLITLTSGVGDGNYGFSDVFFSSSTDGGATWSTPTIVNAVSSVPIDHYQPAVASDKTGNVAVCWYDRSRDKNNFLIDRECAKSTNGGSTWTLTRITTGSYPSVVGQDLLFAFNLPSDAYDELTSDATDSSSGFLGGFVNNQAGNQNVQVNKF